MGSLWGGISYHKAFWFHSSHICKMCTLVTCVQRCDDRHVSCEKTPSPLAILVQVIPGEESLSEEQCGRRCLLRRGRDASLD